MMLLTLMMTISMMKLIEGEIISKSFGCIDNTCNELCSYGIADCNISPIVFCEYGFFKYTDLITKTDNCVPCPFQTLSDPQTLYCQDCYQNPYEWQYNRKCTFYYKIGNGDPNLGTYLELNQEAVLYLIGLSTQQFPTQTNRKLDIKYQAYTCDGCKEFCNDDSDDTCLFVQDLDRINKGIRCNLGFYFWDDQCQNCPSDCAECTSSIECLICKDGYALNDDTYSCVQCQSQCTKCYYDSGDTYCEECSNSLYSKYLITSLDQLQCVSCHSTCVRCEYIDYDNFYYITRDVGYSETGIQRCRQCLMKNQFISYSGTFCEDCTVTNCEICYYQLTSDTTTLDIDFMPTNTLEVKNQKCYKCNKGYKVTTDGNCVIYTPNLNCDQKDSNDRCQHCQNNLILNRIDLNNPECLTVKCSNKILNCLDCYSYLNEAESYIDNDGIKQSTVEPSYQCVKCSTGYYPDIISGGCLQCPLNCGTCWSYTLSYNITGYIESLKIPTNEEIQTWFQEPLEDIMCSTCMQGFDLYDNVCMGCTGNCIIQGETVNDVLNACYFGSSLAYCSSCLFPAQKSINPQLSECWDCPDNCAACKTRDENQKSVNTLFKPESDSLLKYGRLCYRLNNPLPAGVFLDNYLGVPVKCSGLPENSKCTNKQTIQVRVQCDNFADGSPGYLIKKFYPKQSKTGSIIFTKDDSFQQYKSLNSNSVRDLDFIVTLTGGDNCYFQKQTILQLNFLKNVFTLQNVNLVIQAEESEQITFLLKMYGTLIIKGATSVKIKNLKVAYEPVAKPKDKSYGFNLTNGAESQLYFEKVIFAKIDHKYPNCKLTIGVDNPTLISLQTVEFQYLDFVDQLIISNYSMIVSEQKVILKDVTFTDPYLNNTNFIEYGQHSKALNLEIENLKIIQGNLLNSSIINSQGDQSYLDYSVNGFYLMFVLVQNSVLLNLNNLRTGQMKAIDLLQCKLINSIFLKANTFNIDGLFTELLILQQNSIIIQSQDQISQNSLISSTIQQYSFKSLRFFRNKCSSVNCLIKISTPQNAYSIVTSISIDGIEINDIDSTQLDLELTKIVESALCYFTTLKTINLNTIIIDNTRGITVFHFSLFDQFTATTISSDWSKSSMIANPNPEIKGNIQNPTNNLIPSSEQCTERKIQGRSFTYYQFYFSKFKFGINISNLKIQRQLTIDASLIYIESFDVQEFNTTVTQAEYIIFDNVQLYNNSLISYTNGISMASIRVESTQIQKIQFRNCVFQSNHLHVIIKKQTVEVATLIQINSALGIVGLDKINSEYNRISNSDNGIIYILADSFLLSNSMILHTNILDQIWVNRVEENQLITIDQIKAFFEIRSLGSILSLIIQSSTFSTNEFYDAYGVQAGLLITTVRNGSVNINLCQFRDMVSSLELKHSSNGGALYVDSSLSTLNMQISSTSMTNCMSRKKGGCIYLLTSNLQQKVIISNSQFLKCSAIQHSFMSAEFLQSIITPEVQFFNVEVNDNNMDIFLSNIPQIQNIEYLSFSETATVYYQNYGNFIIEKCSFWNNQLTSIFIFQEMVQIKMQSITIHGNKIYLNPLISVNFQTGQAQFVAADIKFTNNTSQEYTNTNVQLDCSSYMQQAFTIVNQEQTCEATQLNMDFVDELSAMDEVYELYDANLLTEYEAITNKYQIGYMSYPKFNQSSFPYQTIIPINNQLVQCLKSVIVYFVYSLNKVLHTALISVDKVSSTTVKMNSISINTNICPQCYGGLIQFRSIEYDSAAYSIVQLVDLSCQSNVVGYYGCLAFTSTSTLSNISISQELKNKLLNYTSTNRLLQSAEIQSQFHNILIAESKFKNNIARVGAAIYALGVSLLVMNTQFSDNQASLVGGGIFFQNSTKNDLFLYKSIFTGNIAQIGGGIYLQDYTLSGTNNLGIVFEMNEADEGGQNLQELTHKLTLQMTNRIMDVQTYMNYSGDLNNDGSIDNTSVLIRDNVTQSLKQIGSMSSYTQYLILPSGQPINSYKYFYEYTQEQVEFNWIFRIVSLNRQGDIVNIGQTGDSCNIEGRIQSELKYDENKQFTDNFTSPNKIFYNTNTQDYEQDELIVTFNPYFEKDYYLELKFTCKSVKIPIYDTQIPYGIVDFNYNYQLFARVRTFPCQIGEVLDGQQCKACLQSDNSYSVVPGNKKCSQMDRTIMKSVTPTAVNLLPGFWRPYYTNDAFEYCNNLPVDCLGGWVPGNPSCYEGHVGALCESCDIYATIYEESWANSAPYVCGKCAATRQFNLIIIIAVSILTLVSVISSVKGTYEALQLQIVEDIINKMGFRLKSEGNNLATVIKTLTNYFQIVQIVGQFQLTLPSGVKETTSTAGNPTGSMASNLDCLLVEMTDVEIVYFKMIWALVMPSAYLLIFFIGYFGAAIFQLTKYNVSVIYTAIIYMFLYLHPTLVQGFISLASSRTISKLPWLKADVAYRYDTPQQDWWMARFIGPMLILWVLLLPLMFMFMVWRKRKVLNLKDTRMKLGYFYKEYSLQSYLWEFVKIFQKEFMVIILVYYEEFVVIKGLLIVLILFLYGWYQVSVRPYYSTVLNQTDRASTVVCGATLCLGVLMYGSQKAGFGYLQVIILLIILVINIWFIIKCLFQIFQGYLLKLADILDKVRDKINENYPDLQSKGPKIRKLLINQGKMRVRVKELWIILKEQTKLSYQLMKKSSHLDFEESFNIIANHYPYHKDNLSSNKPFLQIQTFQEESKRIIIQKQL